MVFLACMTLQKYATSCSKSLYCGFAEEVKIILIFYLQHWLSS